MVVVGLSAVRGTSVESGSGPTFLARSAIHITYWWSSGKVPSELLPRENRLQLVEHVCGNDELRLALRPVKYHLTGHTFGDGGSDEDIRVEDRPNHRSTI